MAIEHAGSADTVTRSPSDVYRAPAA